MAGKILKVRKTTTAEELFRCNICNSCDQNGISFIFKDGRTTKFCHHCKYRQRVKFVNY